MRQQSRWAKHLMKCPEDRGESALFVEWRLERDGSQWKRLPVVLLGENSLR